MFLSAELCCAPTSSSSSSFSPSPQRGFTATSRSRVPHPLHPPTPPLRGAERFFARCGFSERDQQCCLGWNVRCSSRGDAHRGKVMAPSSPEKKVLQQSLCAKKCRTGVAHVSLGRTTPGRVSANIRVRFNWKYPNRIVSISGKGFFLFLCNFI